MPRNIWYGFRTRKSLSSDEIWYAVNRGTGEDMVQAGIVLIGSSLAALALRPWLRLEVLVGMLLFIMSAMMIRMIVHGYAVLKRY